MTIYDDTLTEGPAMTDAIVNVGRFPDTLIESPALTNVTLGQLMLPVSVPANAMNITSPIVAVHYRIDNLTEVLNIAEVMTTFFPVQGILVDGINITTTLTGLKVMQDTLVESPAMTDAPVVTLMLPHTLGEALALTDAIAVQAVLNELLIEGVVLALVVASGGETYIGWVANKETAAHSMWDNFRFDSLAVDGGGVAYGARSDGIYLLEGADDAGAEIDISLLTGKMDFDEAAKKSCPKVLIGAATDGTLLVRVIDDKGDEYIYEAESVRETEDVLQVKPGRGIESRYLQFELYNKDGASLDLSSIEFYPLIMTRSR